MAVPGWIAALMLPAQVRFSEPTAFNDFVAELSADLARLCAKYHDETASTARHRFFVAAYPEIPRPTSPTLRRLAMMYDPTHPGEMLREDYLEPLGLSVTEAAKGLGISRKGLSEILNGRTGISPAMAVKLAKAFCTTPELWLNLQSQYDLWHAQKEVSLDGIAVYCQPEPAV